MCVHVHVVVMEDRLSGNGVMLPSAGGAMSSLGGGIHIEKLVGVGNYNTWKFQMKMVLSLEGLWDRIETIESTADSETDLLRDRRALARICLSVKAACYQHVRHVFSSLRILEKL